METVTYIFIPFVILLITMAGLLLRSAIKQNQTKLGRSIQLPEKSVETDFISGLSSEHEEGSPVQSESSMNSEYNFDEDEKNIISLRRELYREIHGQIVQWVLYESARLSNRLDELTERINQMGKFSEPEIDSIKQEAQKISKEIEIFKSHLSSE